MAVVSTRRGFKPVFTFRSEITDSAVRKEFEQLYAALDALFDTFFNSDGTHKPITTTQVTIQQNTELNETTNPLTIINNNGETVTAAGADTEVQFNEQGAFGARSGFKWIYRNAAAVALGTPPVASVANTGSGAYAATLRYYRIQWATLSGSTPTALSELSTAVSFTPSGTGTAARVTRSAPASSPTHWAVFASADGISYKHISGYIAIATTTYDDSVAPASYSGNAPYSDGAYTSAAQLLLTSGDSSAESLQVWRTATGFVAMKPWSSDYQEMMFGAELVNGEYIARSQMVCFLAMNSQADAAPGGGYFAMQIFPSQTIGSICSFTNGRGFYCEPEGDFRLEPVALGTGAQIGRRVKIGRNSSGNGAASSLILEDKSGNEYALWVDATGDLRIGSAAPTESGSVSDTSGTVVGTQS